MTKQLEARAFAIWRYATIQDWDCSYEEIADATGLTYNQVLYTINRKGFGGRIGSGRGGGITTATSQARHKERGHRFDENNLDLCQLIGWN